MNSLKQNKVKVFNLRNTEGYTIKVKPETFEAYNGFIGIPKQFTPKLIILSVANIREVKDKFSDKIQRVCEVKCKEGVASWIEREETTYRFSSIPLEFIQRSVAGKLRDL